MSIQQRREFEQYARGLHDLAAANLRRDGRVAEVMLGLDARLDTTFMAIAGGAGSDPADLEMAAQQGMFVAPDSLALSGDDLEVQLRTSESVCAVVIGEAWRLGADETAHMPRPGESIADHPDRREVVYVAAAWPREHLGRVWLREIVRDAQGCPDVGPSVEDVSNLPAVAHFLWFAARLPQPPGRRA